MKIRLNPFIALTAFAALLVGGSSIGNCQSPRPDDDVVAMLQKRLKPDTDTCLVVGIITPRGRKVFVAGRAGVNGVPAVNEKTVFEIGSVTKVFTSALLADMAGKGEVKLDDPAAKYLPADVKMPTRGGRQITLVDLATHTSGLPRLPMNWQPKDFYNPYADYTVANLYDFLSHYELTRDIGAEYEYSNLGMGLLGHVLALKAGKTYEALVTDRILAPLHMTDTAITLSPSLRARLAVGHDAAGHPVANWDIPTLAGAGALRSTLDDMLGFLQANLEADKPGVPAALQAAHVSRHSPALPGGSIGLAWHIRPSFGRDIIWHNGGTGGYHSFIAFDKKAKTGVVVLHNSAASIDDIGFHLLEPRIPLSDQATPAPAKARTEIKVDESVLEKYVGEYQLAPKFSIVVTREGNQLFITPTGQGRAPIYAESESEFFLKIVDAQITFVRDSTGRVIRLVLHQNGSDMPGERK